MTGTVPELEKLRRRGTIHRAAKTITRIRGRTSTKPGMPDVAIRSGTVKAIDPSSSPTRYTVTVGGVDVVGVVCLAAQQPPQGETVALVCSGTDWAIVGFPGADDDAPRGAIAYADRTSPDSATVSAEAMLNPPNVTVTLRSMRILRVTFGGLMIGSTASTVARLTLRRATGSSSPVLADTRVRLAQEVAGATNGQVSVSGVARDVLDPGVYTYGLSHMPALGGGTTQAHCGAGFELFIWVEDAGGA